MKNKNSCFSYCGYDGVKLTYILLYLTCMMNFLQMKGNETLSIPIHHHHPTHVQSDHSNFSSSHFTHSQNDWKSIQKILNCFISNGTWIFDSNKYQYFDPNEDYAKNFQEISPCSGYRMYAGRRNPCRDLLKGNSSFYSWRVNTTTSEGKGKECGDGLVQLTSFHHQEFCEVMNGENLLFVGDSMMDLMKITLANQFLFSKYSGEGYHYYDTICGALDLLLNCSHRENVASVPSPSSSSSPHWFNDTPLTTNTPAVDDVILKVYFRRNDDLSLIYEDLGHNRAENMYRLSWIRLLNSSYSNDYDPKIRTIVLNRGIHYQSNTTLLIEELRATFQYLRSNYPHITLLWRSTVHGHYNSQDTFFDPPLPKSYDIREDLPDHHPNFHYESIPEQNEQVSRFIEEEFPEIIQLDTYSITKGRRDGHMDPLHYCIPGPVDAWNELLLAALKLIRIYSHPKRNKEGDFLHSPHHHLHHHHHHHAHTTPS